MTTDLKAIRAAAEAATPGPWKSRKGFHTDTVEIFKPNRSIKKPFYPSELATVHVDLDNGGANAKHIVTANPATIIELLDRLKAAEKDAARYQWLAWNSDTNPIMPYDSENDRFYYRHECDEAIDAAMKDEQK